MATLCPYRPPLILLIRTLTPTLILILVILILILILVLVILVLSLPHAPQDGEGAVAGRRALGEQAVVQRLQQLRHEPTQHRRRGASARPHTSAIVAHTERVRQGPGALVVRRVGVRGREAARKLPCPCRRVAVASPPLGRRRWGRRPRPRPGGVHRRPWPRRP